MVVPVGLVTCPGTLVGARVGASVESRLLSCGASELAASSKRPAKLLAILDRCHHTAAEICVAVDSVLMLLSPVAT